MGARAWLGSAALAILAAISVAIAAGGPAAVPAAGSGGDPGWLEGVFGGGLGLAEGDYLRLERAALVAWAVVVACAGAIPRRLLWGGIGACVGLLALAPPLLSLDVFSYVSYARLEALHGLNPYESAPSAAPGDEAVTFVGDFRDAVSVYGPLFTILSLPLGELGVGAAVWTLKAVAALSVLGTAALAARAAAARGVEPRMAAALVALNPLVLVHVVGGAHNDAPMALAMTAGVAAILARRELAGGAAIAAAAALKASALLVAPFAALGGPGRSRTLAGLLAAGFALALAGLLAFGTSVTEALEVVAGNQDSPSRASVPANLARETPLDLDAARTVCVAAFAVAIAGLLAWTARGGDWVRASGWAALAVLAGTSYLAPWYVIWALPPAAISRDRALVAASVAFTAFLLRYQVPGLGG